MASVLVSSLGLGVAPSSLTGAQSRPAWVALAWECASGSSLDALDRLIERPPSVMGYDSATYVGLGEGRAIWFVSDAFIDTTGTSEHFTDPTARYLNNAAFLQDGRCLSLLVGGSAKAPMEFEIGEQQGSSYYQFFWPRGGELIDGRLVMFWSQMITETMAGPSDGIVRRPVATWRATYDPITLERLDFRPASNTGVLPQYGSSIATDGAYTYLFGNSNVLSYRLEGGFFGDHSATEMYLARVAAGQLHQLPQYYSDGDWLDDPTAATTISSRFELANIMRPVRYGDRWVSVTKQDELVGSRLVIDVAEQPWGPWKTVYDEPATPPIDGPNMTLYHPLITPWQSGEGTLRVLMSMNSLVWEDSLEDASLYRPTVLKIDVSEIPELSDIFGPSDVDLSTSVFAPGK